MTHDPVLCILHLGFDHLGFDHLDLFGAWDLGFGIFLISIA